MNHCRYVVLAIALAVAAPCADAAPEKYAVDVTHSAALFKVKHFGVSLVAGRFNEIAGTITGFQNLVESFLDRVAGLDFTLGQFKIAHDALKNIVEIMRDAACQGSHRFHFLGLTQLFFKPAQAPTSPHQKNRFLMRMEF